MSKRLTTADSLHVIPAFFFCFFYYNVIHPATGLDFLIYGGESDIVKQK